MIAHGPRKTLEQMSNKEIVSSLIAFIVICGFIMAACAVAAIRDQSAFSIAWNGVGVIVAASVLASYLPRVFHELRARKGPAALRGSSGGVNNTK